MNAPPAGYVSDLERVCDIVSDWAVRTILEATKVLMPDGRPFGYVDDPQMKMRDYLQLRGNPQAWELYLQTQAQEIVDKLTTAGLPWDAVLSVHPYDLAQKFAVEFSAHMEGQLQKESPDALIP